MSYKGKLLAEPSENLLKERQLTVMWILLLLIAFFLPGKQMQLLEHEQPPHDHMTIIKGTDTPRLAKTKCSPDFI